MYNMAVYTRLCLLGILLDNFSGAMGHCFIRGLDINVPNFDVSVLSYPDDSSPNYGKGLTCRWLFRSADTTLKLLFRVADLSVSCGDVLKAFDGTTEDDRLLEVFCSSGITPEVSPFYVTSSNQMFLRFITDTVLLDAVREKGFKLEILSARSVAYEIEACNSTIKTLTATTDEGVLTSPGFPVIYPSSKNCSWNITSPTESGTIIIIVLFLDTETKSSSECYDFITTYDGQERKQICDKSSFKQITLLFNSSFVEIGFYSDDRIQGIGFLLRYSFLGEAATTESSTTSTSTTEISTTEATTTTTIAESTTISTAETTMSTSETTTISTVEITMSTAETTTISSSETTTSNAESTTRSTPETTTISTVEITMSTAETTTISSSETTTSNAESSTRSTSETTTGTITTETTISETTHFITISSSSPTAGTTQNLILSLTLEGVIFLIVLLIIIFVFSMTACIVCFVFVSRTKNENVQPFLLVPLPLYTGDVISL